MRIVFVGGRYTHAGRHRRWAGVFPTARQAELAAAFVEQGHTPVLLADAEVHLPLDIARLVWRLDPDAIVVCGDSVPAVVVEVLRTSAAVVVVTTASIPAGDGAVHQADVSAVLAASGVPQSAAGPTPPPARSQVVPPALRAGVGIELVRRDPDGIVRSNDAAVVAACLLGAQAAAAESGRLVALSGLEDLPVADAVAFLGAVSDHLEAPASGATLRVRARDAGEALAVASARLVRSACLVVRDVDDVDALREAISTFERVGVDVGVLAHFDDIDVVEDVADIVLASGVELVYVWVEQTAPAVKADGDRILAETASPSLTEQAVIGPIAALAALLSGRFGTDARGGGLDAILVTADPPPGDIAAAGLRTEVFSTSGALNGNGRHWLFDAPAGSPRPLAGDGEVRLDGLTFEVSGYRRGRHVTPFESLVLRFDDLQDIEAFLADADIAYQHGRFPSALLSGFTLLADACAWGEAGACRGGQLRRAACSDGTHLRASLHGPVLGDVGQPWTELARTARQEVAAAKRRRGCRDCPVASLCSQDLCLSALIDDEQYCRQRRARPWLVGYLDAIDAIRKVRSDPAQAVPRVGGFGGAIHAEMTSTSWPERPSVVLMEWQGGFYGYTPASDQAFRLTPDTAFIAEALMVHPTSGQAAATVEARFGLTAAQAGLALGRVERLLNQRGVVIADAVAVSAVGGPR